MDDMTRSVIITYWQIRAGRIMAGLTQAELAREAELSTTGLNNIESGGTDAKGSTLRRLQAALEAHGIEFTNDRQPGVSMRRPPTEESRGRRREVAAKKPKKPGKTK